MTDNNEKAAGPQASPQTSGIRPTISDATRAVDAAQQAEAFGRKAFAHNAVLYAIKQRGLGDQFTDHDVQCSEMIAKTLDRIASGQAPARVPNGAQAPVSRYSTSISDLTKAIVTQENVTLE